MSKSDIKVVCIGGCYVDFNMANFPFPEMGVASDNPEQEIMSPKPYELVAGGSAVNFCRSIVSASMQPIFFGTIGQDPMAEVLRQEMKRDGIDARLTEVEGASTGVSFNMTGAGKHVMLGSSNANTKLDESILNEVERELDDAEYLFLGGIYKLKDILPHLSRIVEVAKSKNVKTVIDHARVPMETPQEDIERVREIVYLADIYLPSRDEFLETWQVDDIHQGLEFLKDQSPHLKVAVKNGAEAVVVSENGAVSEVQPPRVEAIVDVTGAGDMFNSVLMSEYVNSGDFKEAVARGCAAASEKISGKK